MSQKDDLIDRIKSKPKDFTISELDSLMSKCGCTKITRGRTSGSAIAYIHNETKLMLRIHYPQPQKELKPYMVKLVLGFLEQICEL